MSPIQWPRNLSEASLAASSLDVRKTSRSAGDGGEEALRYAVASGRGDRLQRSGHIDEVLFGSLLRVIGPGARVREGVERPVQGDQSDHLIAGRVVEFLQGDLADDLVAEIAPGPRATGWRDEGYGKREGDKMPEQVRVEVQSAAILISVRSSSKMAESSLNRCWRSITECPYTWSP